MKRVVLVAVLALVLPQAAMAQGPFVVRVFHPLGVSGPFLLGAPIPIVVQFTSTTTVTTNVDLAETDLLSRLYFAFDGGIITYTGSATAQRHTQPAPCLAHGGVLVVPAKSFSGSLEQGSSDIRSGYDLSRARVYNVTARFPISTFSQVFTDCEKFPAGTQVVDVGPGNAFRQDLFVVSSSFEVRVVYGFDGFDPPVGAEATCSLSPCHTFTFGDTAPMKFRLFDVNGTPVTSAVARISVEQVSGTPPPTPPKDLGQGSRPTNQYRFDGQRYIFNLDSKVLSPGVWRAHTKLDDGTDHTVLLEFK